ncbi:6-kinase [Xylanimonas cellulosilytica DSM 15894]|uniref:6-kinase n=1 Tax=Xylanimonas cellulosilytica (strain DSM 15894 / JCM 12276 / CECT 5975 / KCTC 9989 / LMG 20990 / NBRC 107835 / XIL07) TaxID=446471 RepID=D1BUQ9_XYLCX|nr:aminoglycoside phosphotransferase family protein [Xylanimonas cellulosilytica]ACZ29300.1 6-kinase [Xylanimonas cellulosilytica DSM 15894]
MDRTHVPEALAASHQEYWGDDARAWVDAAPAVLARLLDAWTLTPDGPATHGTVAWIVPVRRADGSPAVLKLQPQDEETVGEPTALAAWGGDGAVLMLEHDAASGAMLLERLDATRSLDTIDVDTALETIGGLARRLHAHAPPATTGLRRLADDAARILERTRVVAASSGPDLRDVLDRCAAVVTEVLPEPGDRLLHWDLHYRNVLAPLPGSAAAARGDWLAIDPKPLLGDPGYELLPAVHNRWELAVATGDPAREGLRRLDLLTEVMGLDRDRARAWTLARLLANLTWLAEGHRAWFADPDLTLARALLRRS